MAESFLWQRDFHDSGFPLSPSIVEIKSMEGGDSATYRITRHF